MSTRRLTKGDPLPWLIFPQTPEIPPLRIEALGGHFAIICFLATNGQGATAEIDALARGLAGSMIMVVLVTDGTADPLPPARRNLHLAADPGGVLRTAFGASAGCCACFVASPRLALLYEKHFASDALGLATMQALSGQLPRDLQGYNRQVPPPVLLLENIIEPALAAEIITAYQGGRRFVSPALTETGGIATADHSARKSRTDGMLSPHHQREVEERLFGRIAPEIARAFQFQVSGIDRVVVGCYEARKGGRFNAHRDNTLDETRHRRFAVSINLNDGYEGGFIGFPEYSGSFYQPPTGGAIAFSCSMMHLVTPITAGARYALLFFLT